MYFRQILTQWAHILLIAVYSIIQVQLADNPKKRNFYLLVDK